MKIKKVRFASDVKKWDGICYKTKFIEDFILNFAKYSYRDINKDSVNNYIKKMSNKNNPYRNNLELLFNHISELLKKIKGIGPEVQIPFFPRGGGTIKFVTNEHFQFLDHIDNILIELVFT